MVPGIAPPLPCLLHLRFQLAKTTDMQMTCTTNFTLTPPMCGWHRLKILITRVHSLQCLTSNSKCLLRYVLQRPIRGWWPVLM
uniref:Uncharacterized protein n=1 Tax=Rhizophora mucronata TaxID=61149 RepID=A0A2P2Q0C4_RHIMU